MQIQVDSLKYAKLLVKNGFSQNQAEGLVESLTTLEIHNIYDKNESDNMLSETVKNVIEEQRVNLRHTIEEQRRILDLQHQESEKRLAEQRQESEKRLNEQRREFDKRMELAERRIDSEIAESRSRHRWLIGTIVTVGAAIIGYLSTVVHQIVH